MATRTGFYRPSLPQWFLSAIALTRIAKSGGATPVPSKPKKARRPRIASSFRMPDRRTRSGRRLRAKLAAAGMQRHQLRAKSITR